MKLTLPKAALGLAVSLYTALSSADLVSHQVGSSKDISFSWGVPEASASSDSGPLYFQLSAPEKYTWVGLGLGSGMTGAHVFIMWQDGKGNVTLSNRKASGHFMPSPTDQGKLELLSGSGVKDGKMVANIRATDLQNVQLNGQNSWISAWKTGDPLDSDNTDEQITEHDDDGKVVFKVDFSQASISQDANPFQGDNTNTSTPSNGNNGSNSNNNNTAVSGEDNGGNMDTILLAHGIIMTLVFVVLYPLGSMLMPLLGKWLIHASWQFIAFLLMWAGFSLGYVYANHDGIYFKQAHTGMGTIVVALLSLQPLFGYLHHAHYRKHESRGIMSHIHVWYGRVLIIWGIICGGFGLELAGNTSGSFLIGYCVAAGLVTVLYLASIFFGIFKGKKMARGGERRKDELSPQGSA